MAVVTSVCDCSLAELAHAQLWGMRNVTGPLFPAGWKWVDNQQSQARRAKPIWSRHRPFTFTRYLSWTEVDWTCQTWLVISLFNGRHQNTLDNSLPRVHYRKRAEAQADQDSAKGEIQVLSPVSCNLCNLGCFRQAESSSQW